jgi:glycosyltransferase involved in cell wall biosynthesis
MKKILFIAAHRPGRSPSQRFRFEQYFEFLNKNGFQFYFSYLITEAADKYFYNPGSYNRKLYLFLKSILKRFRDLIIASRYDIIFIQREAFMTGTTFFEKNLKNSKAKILFDFDDAIWIHDVSDANKKFAWLKNPDKIATIIRLADMVFAGNNYLATYALQFNPCVKIVPTTIDTDEYKRLGQPKENGTICIGWSGSITTIKHFKYAELFLEKIKLKYGNRVSIKVIGDASYTNKVLGIQGINWSLEKEIEDLSGFDIGIMPLPDDEWANGKCGLKGLQYMALEIPTIMSPVGVNSEIIKNGVNGFLASSIEEWVETISLLIESKELRYSLGKAARNTVIESYSKSSQKENYLKYFNELIESKNNQ